MAIFTPLSEVEADRLVRAYGLGTLSRVTPIAAGSVNSNFRIEVARDGEPRTIFLRIFEEQGLEGARWDAKLVAHLADRGVPTPRPLVGSDGSPIGLVGDKPVALFPFVPGVHSCQRAVDEERARAVGTALAEVHLAACDFEPQRAG